MCGGGGGGGLGGGVEDGVIKSAFIGAKLRPSRYILHKA